MIIDDLGDLTQEKLLQRARHLQIDARQHARRPAPVDVKQERELKREREMDNGIEADNGPIDLTEEIDAAPDQKRQRVEIDLLTTRYSALSNLLRRRCSVVSVVLWSKVVWHCSIPRVAHQRPKLKLNLQPWGLGRN